jgi:hypothetical protein
MTARASIAFTPRLLAAPDAASYLGVSASTLRGLRMYAYVDGRRGWEIDGVEVEDTVTTFQLFGDAGRRFINELIYGQRLYVDYNAQDTQPGAWDVSFSLAGSAAAIAALNDCIGKL